MKPADKAGSKAGCLRRQFLQTAATSVVAIGAGLGPGAAFAQATRKTEDAYQIVIIGDGLAGPDRSSRSGPCRLRVLSRT